ncbi:hypothetical protein JKP88DRAFT_256191, partial [Tribonema minus]
MLVALLALLALQCQARQSQDAVGATKHQRRQQVVDPALIQPAHGPPRKLLWHDEFELPLLNRDIWDYEEGGGGFGNNELQYYQAPNVLIEDGQLVLQDIPHLRGSLEAAPSAVPNALSSHHDGSAQPARMHGVLLRLRFSIAAAAAKGTASGGARIAVEAYGREHCDYWRLLVTMKQVHGLVHGRASPATADGAGTHNAEVCNRGGRSISLRAPQPRPPSQLTVTQPASGTLAGFVRRRYCQMPLVHHSREPADSDANGACVQGATPSTAMEAPASPPAAIAAAVDTTASAAAADAALPPTTPEHRKKKATTTKPLNGRQPARRKAKGYTPSLRHRIKIVWHVLKVRVGPWEEAASLLTGAIVTIYAKSNAGARGNNLSQVKQAGSATDRALRIVVYDPRRARIAEACITGEKDLRECTPVHVGGGADARANAATLIVDDATERVATDDVNIHRRGTKIYRGARRIGGVLYQITAYELPPTEAEAEVPGGAPALKCLAYDPGSQTAPACTTRRLDGLTCWFNFCCNADSNGSLKLLAPWSGGPIGTLINLTSPVKPGKPRADRTLARARAPGAVIAAQFSARVDGWDAVVTAFTEGSTVDGAGSVTSGSNTSSKAGSRHIAADHSHAITGGRSGEQV